MDEREYITHVFEQDKRLRDYIGDTTMNAQMENIKDMRELVFRFITIASGIIGFSIPILGESPLIKTASFFIGGQLLLLSVVLYGFFYLTRLLQKESKDLSDIRDRYIAYLDDERDAIRKFLTDRSSENFEALKIVHNSILDDMNKHGDRKEKPDQAFDILFTLFSSGIVYLVLSLFDWCRIVSHVRVGIFIIFSIGYLFPTWLWNI